jgi:membrane-associated phospholipid phosphatase
MKKIKLSFIIFLMLLLSVSSKIHAQHLDINLLSKIHADSSIIKDHSFNFLSNTAAPLAVMSPISLLITGFINDDNELKREGYMAAASLAFNSAITIGLKYAVNRKRPFVRYLDKLNPKAHVGPFSFPSGHTSTAFSMATSLTLATKKWYVGVPAFAWASGVAYSRMYLGVHYPSDLLGGMIIGIGTSLLTWQIDKWLIKHQKI